MDDNLKKHLKPSSSYRNIASSEESICSQLSDAIKKLESRVLLVETDARSSKKESKKVG